MKSLRPTPALSRRIGAVAIVMVGAVSACDLSVSNPGPIADDLLNNPGAHAAVVAGASQALSRAVAMEAFFGADAAKEFTQGGRIHPTKLPVLPGQLTVDGIPNDPWDLAQRARWIAEDGVRRLKDSKGTAFASYKLGGQALVYAGFANRLLGDNMCEAVIDGSAAQPIAEHYKRAEKHFTEAIAVATAAADPATANAARAGRAQVRLVLGNNAGALEDAAAVPAAFKFQAVYSTLAEVDYNLIYWISANQPYRAHSEVRTFFETYYTSTGDPRVAWTKSATVPNAELSNVPWYPQTKYTLRDSPINLASGREMRLIEAEVALRAGDFAKARDLINALRASVVSTTTSQPLQPSVVVTNVTEGWTALKRERSIELFLEARRLGDERRWTEGNTPGAMDQDVSDRVRLCLPITNNERQTNTNVGTTHVDPKNPQYKGNLL